MVGPWVVPYSSVDLGVWVSCSFGTELPYRPVVTMPGIEKVDESICGVAVGSLRVGGGGARCSNNLAQIGLSVYFLVVTGREDLYRFTIICNVA